jgi:putative transposase
VRNDIVRLTTEHKAFLTHYSSTGVHSARSIRRAQTLLLADQGMLQKDIAAQFGCHPVTISETIRRYHACGDDIEGALTEKPRPGKPSKITPEIEARITVMACEQNGPDGRGRWNLRLMSKRLIELAFVETISPETVRQVLKKVSSGPGRKNNGAPAR